MNTSNISKTKIKQKFKKLLALAISGDVNSQFEVANAYMNGARCVSRDVPKAIDWYQKAAAQGHSQAKKILKEHAEEQYKLAFGTDGAILDLGKVMVAANLGHPEAQNSLGLLYSRGDVVPHDAKKAVEYYRWLPINNAPLPNSILLFALKMG